MRLLLLSVCLMSLAGFARADDWPQFRGPAADGISRERGINKDWKTKAPQILWRRAMNDDGYAAPSAADGVLYIVDHIGGDDILLALNLADGNELWRLAWPEATKNQYGYTVSTPLVHEGRVYVLSRMGKVICADAKTGKELWRRDMIKEMGGRFEPWKYALSPVRDGDRLLVVPGGGKGAVAALELSTGKILWQGGGTGTSSYASIVVANIAGNRQYLLFAGEGLTGVGPDDGTVLWNLPWTTPYGNKKATTPVMVDGKILISASEGAETGLIDASSGEPKVLWKNKTIQCHFSTPIFYHGRLYCCSDPQPLLCVEPTTGQTIWSTNGFKSGSVLGVDDTVIALSGSSGRLVMIDATASEYKQLGEFTPLGGESWAAPILADGNLVVRNKKELACVDLR